jgi:hypothetical protein
MDAERKYRLARELRAFDVIILHGYDLSLIRIALATACCQAQSRESSVFSALASVQGGPGENQRAAGWHLRRQYHTHRV